LTDDTYSKARFEMVDRQLRKRGIKDVNVLRAMLTVPREEFVPQSSKNAAYTDEPLGIGGGQTI